MIRDQEIKGSVRRLFKAREQKQMISDVEQEETKNISNYMYCNGLEEMEVLLDDDEQFCISPAYVKVKKSCSTTINFLSEKLKKALSKEIYKDIIDVEYQVVDMKGLTKYLKSCGVDPKVFKKHIRKKETINKEKFNKYYDFGDIKMSDIKGCYTVKKSKPYIRITEIGGNKG